MKKGIVISFTGSGGFDIPLLYYSSTYFFDKGYDVERIYCLCRSDSEFEKLYASVKAKIADMDLSEYEDIIFISKSIGTYISCRIKEELKIPARLVLYTPIEETLPYMKSDNDIILVAAGDKDSLLATEKLQEVCRAEKLNYIIEEGVGHRMEETGNLEKTLSVVKDVVMRLQTLA